MPITAQSLYLTTNDLLSKNAGVTISPVEFGRYVTIASLDLFDELRGAKNLNKATYGRSRTLDGRLSPFRVRTALTFAAGVATKPATASQILSIITTAGAKVIPTDEDREANVLADPLSEDFYYIEEATDLRIVKGAVTTGFIRFLKTPNVVAGTITLAGRVPTLTETLEWDKNMERELLNRILGQLGTSMKDQFITQVANNNEAKE
jgi:hypothetical protein